MANQFVIEVGPLEYEGTNPPSVPDRLLGVQANVRIVVDGREWFNQPMFPVVELAAAVTTWLRRGGDFEFETMDADESPFLWVRAVPGGFRVGAAWQTFSIEEPLPAHTVRGALERFAAEIPEAAKGQLGIDISDRKVEAG
jgi:hypothetical protein